MLIITWCKIIGNRNNNIAVVNVFVNSGEMVLVFRLTQWMRTWHVEDCSHLCEFDVCKTENAVNANVAYICNVIKNTHLLFWKCSSGFCLFVFSLLETVVPIRVSHTITLDKLSLCYFLFINTVNKFFCTSLSVNWCKQSLHFI